MRILVLAVFLSALLFSTTIHAESQGELGLSVTEWLTLGNTERQWYLEGMLHGYFYTILDHLGPESLGVNRTAGILLACISMTKEHWTIESFEAKIKNYLQKHPEQWRQPLYNIVLIILDCRNRMFNMEGSMP